MKYKTFKIHKLTFGGKLIKRIDFLLLDKILNGFEVIILVKGLLNLTKLSLLHLRYISIEYSGDFIILEYPDLQPF